MKITIASWCLLDSTPRRIFIAADLKSCDPQAIAPEQDLTNYTAYYALLCSTHLLGGGFNQATRHLLVDGRIVGPDGMSPTPLTSDGIRDWLSLEDLLVEFSALWHCIKKDLEVLRGDLGLPTLYNLSYCRQVSF